MRKHLAGNNPDISDRQQDCVTAKGWLLEAERMIVYDTVNDRVSPPSGIHVIPGNMAYEELLVSVTSALNAWIILGTATGSQGYTVPGRCPDYQLSESGCYLLSCLSSSGFWTTGLFPLKHVSLETWGLTGLNIFASLLNVHLWAWAALNYASICPIFFSL